jgi:hypothetical protein
MTEVREVQRLLCDRYGTAPMPPEETFKIGISEGALNGGRPLNGLRHPPDDGTTGWFIWSGSDLSEEPGFFKPLHLYHLPEMCSAILPYLALPPGWRFLIADDHEDVWFDAALLTT